MVLFGGYFLLVSCTLLDSSDEDSDFSNTAENPQSISVIDRLPDCSDELITHSKDILD